MIRFSGAWVALLFVLILDCTAAAEDWLEWPSTNSGNGHWYSITPPVPRSGADLWVSRLEANLVSITSLEEDTFVRWDVAHGERAWIGLHGGHGNFAWSDGSPVSYMPGYVWNAPDFLPSADFFLNYNTNTNVVHWGVLFASPHYGALLERTNSPYEGPVRFMGNLLVRQPDITNSINGYVPEGSIVEIRADVFGERPVALQWQLGGIDLPDQTNSMLVVSNVVPNGSAYRLLARNRFGLESSEDYVLPVIPIRTNLGISWFQWPAAYGGTGHWYGLLDSTLPVDKAEAMAQLFGGHLASFADTNELNFAAGLLTLQVRRLTGLIGQPGSPFTWTDGTPVSSEILQALDIPAGTNDGILPRALFITVRDKSLSDLYSWSTAAPLIEITNNPDLLRPVIANYPPIGESYSTGTAQFQAQAFGPEPLSYQWKVNGQPIARETNSTYTMLLSTLSTGLVSVAVSNPNGTVESSPVPVKIFPVRFAGSLRWAQWAPEIGGNGNWYASWNTPTNLLSWRQAEQFAGALGSSLISVENPAEWEWLIRLWDRKSVVLPLGLTDRALEGTFEWTDGTPFNFELWEEGEPTTERAEERDFAYAISQGTWYTSPDFAESFQTVVFERATAPTDIAPIISSATVAPLHVTIGRPQTLNVEVFAAEESIYEWRLNGNLVSTGATAQLNLNPASTNESGLYQLIVRNAYGSATSAPVSVTILEPIILRTVFEKDFSKFEIHFDFPAAVEQVELEYSFDLQAWFPLALKGADEPSFFFTEETQPSHNVPTEFYRVKRPL